MMAQLTNKYKGNSNMKFQWETIFSKNLSGHLRCTDRAKVFGGWLVKNTIYCPFDSEKNNEAAVSESMVFVADANHEWQIE